MRRTKIVATLGPASSGPDAIAALIAAGVDVFRLNFSHGTHASHAEVYARVRSAAARAGRIVAVMQDLSGPKIRTTALQEGRPVELVPGEELRLRAGEEAGGPGLVFTPYAELIHSARPGDRLLLDDGRIELRVTRATGEELVTTVVSGGTLGQNKGINAPGVALPASAITPKDADDLRFGLDLGVDYIALSFVQTADDVRRARTIMEEAGRRVPLIAKIERPAAVQNLAGILELAQAVMVARGDLGLEMPLEKLPRVQKEIARRARAAGRPVIIATQVLESMRVDPRPTRAEVSDAANAVGEGADAIMLAGETAVGAWPVRAVETLSSIIVEAELAPADDHVAPAVDPTGSLHGRALCEAAVTLATTGRADAIVAVTREGKTARLLSALRPQKRIIAATPDERVAGMLALFHGVTPMITPVRDPEVLERSLVERRVVAAGSTVVFINVSPDMTRADANFLNVQRIG
ncbi:MAG TPA: pyruvate kinase [Vicinamibacterales bacterium]|nr:pyruvate kinase [Vicinamibacterales bacterium]